MKMKLPYCTDKKCGSPTFFIRFHPFHSDKEIRGCEACGARYAFDIRGADDTVFKRKAK
jgi:hypothetical protein